MLNTQKLFYILPEIAFIAELLPGKKPSSFQVQSFHQINGEYLDDNEFIAPHILKLFEKVEAENYHLVLPDFLFTNTIVNIKETSDAKIKKYLSDTLLPELSIDTQTHQVDTTVLTQHGKTSKIQLSAIEKSVLEPLQISAQKAGIKISGISPLSWTIKSLVSLEPAISLIQVDQTIYSALQYIGVDQVFQTSVDDLDAIFQHIQTLKGSEPSIQTIYLLSNTEIETELKQKLSDLLPVQQLADESADQGKMPAYLKAVVEAGMRTLSIPDYPVPKFELGKAPAGASIKVDETAALVTTVTQDETDQESVKEEEMKEELETELPKPTKKVEPNESEIEEVDDEVEEDEVDDQDDDDQIEALLSNLKTDSAEAKTSADKPESIKPTMKEDQPVKKVIKNTNKTTKMLKMIFVTLAVFFATVGVGIGIGLGVLQLTQSNQPDQPVTPVTEVSPAPLASPLPSPSPEPEINKAELSILVVNATTQAGYAGTTADLLQKSEFGSVDASNAKGDYEPGTYVLMETEDEALIKILEESTEKTLIYQSDIAVEDPKGDYDAVIVLAE